MRGDWKDAKAQRKARAAVGTARSGKVRSGNVRSGVGGAVGAAAPGSVREYFERLQQVRPGDLVEEVSDWDAEHSENGIEPKATVGSQTTSGYKTRREMIAEESCDKAKQRLLSLGQCLDLITPKERWRTDPNTQEVWKPTYRDDWIEESLNIRTKIGGSTLIRLNPVQREYSRVCLKAGSKRNIVLKARQVGITSYIAARFFVRQSRSRGL